MQCGWFSGNFLAGLRWLSVKRCLKQDLVWGWHCKSFWVPYTPAFSLSSLLVEETQCPPQHHCFHSTSERQGSALTLETKRGWHNCSSWWGSFRARALGSRSGSDRPTTRSTHTSRSTKAEPPGSGWISWKTKLWKIKQWDAFPVQKANSLE